MVWHNLVRMYVCGCARACACVCVCVYVEERNMYIGTIHQLSTCNQHFRGLMTVCYMITGLPASKQKTYLSKDVTNKTNIITMFNKYSL